MPELPEVEVVRSFLESRLVGKKILKINVISKKLRYEVPSNLNSKFSNAIITKILRRGKYLILLFNDLSSCLLVHLGMTGYFRTTTKLNPKKHDHIIFFLKKQFLIFNDIRKFGFFKIYKKKDLMISSHLKSMGVEPLTQDLNEKYFKLRSQRNIDVKSLLMDQSFISGLGNIYCSEILFEAKINPLRNSSTLNQKEIKEIIRSIKKILKKAISYGGTTIKNFIVSEEKIGYFKNELKVYSRENKICLRCSNEEYVIKKTKQKGRSTFFCKKCQK